MDLNAQIANWEILIRSGQKLAVRRDLAKLSLAKIPREQIHAVANMARRVNLPLLALRALLPIVRPKTLLNAPASPDELALYAAVLIKLGANSEAHDLLESIKDQTPEAALYRGFAFLAQWNYAAAIPWFRKFSNAPGITDYQRAIGQLNLAAAYVYVRNHDQANKLLTPLSTLARKLDWNLIYGNTLELQASTAVSAEEWGLARKLISEAVVRLPESHLDRVQLRKLQAVVELKSVGLTERVQDQFQSVRQDALAHEMFEIVRDCDFYLAQAWRDFDLCSHVFFGTPYVSYQKRILTENANWFSAPETVIWRLGDASTSDLLELTQVPKLEKGSVPHRLLSLLTTDFYRPQMIGSVFADLYPGEQFNPDTSPPRIARLVHRLREWADENKFPLEFTSNRGMLSLQASRPFGLILRAERALPERHEVVRIEAIQKLKQAYPYRAFSSYQAAQALGISPRSANNYLAWALDDRKIYRSGTGRATRYRFAK